MKNCRTMPALLACLVLLLAGCSAIVPPVPQSRDPAATLDPTRARAPSAAPSPTAPPAALDRTPFVAPTPGVMLLADSFNPPCALASLDQDYAAEGCQGGEYVILVKQAHRAQWATYNTSVQDAIIQVDAHAVSGSGDFGYGIVFRVAADAQALYLFEVTRGGRFAFYRLSDSTWTPLVPRTASRFVKTEGTNRLRIVAVGDQLGMYVNDQWLATVADGTSGQGALGLVVDSPVEGARVGFANLRVWGVQTPPDMPTGVPRVATPTRSPAPSSTPRAASPTPSSTPAPTETPAYPLPPGQGGLVVHNYYGGDMVFTIVNTQYRIPGGGEIFIVLDPDTYTWSASIHGVLQTNGSVTIEAGQLSEQQFSSQE